MVNALSEIMALISDYLIKGIFITIAVIGFSAFVSKNKIKTNVSIQIIRWIMLAYALLVVVTLIVSLTMLTADTDIFIQRMTGSYWWSYWLMLSTTTVIPMLLWVNRIGRNFGWLVIIGVLMNIGWLFESLILHTTSVQRDFITESFNPYLPTDRERMTLLNGFILGLILLIVENVLLKRMKLFKLK